MRCYMRRSILLDLCTVAAGVLLLAAVRDCEGFVSHASAFGGRRIRPYSNMMQEGELRSRTPHAHRGGDSNVPQRTSTRQVLLGGVTVAPFPCV